MNIQLVTWINCAIVVVSTMAITLYINYRLNRLIKMLDESITERPE